jgi:hypothetical protein
MNFSFDAGLIARARELILHGPNLIYNRADIFCRPQWAHDGYMKMLLVLMLLGFLLFLSRLIT